MVGVWITWEKQRRNEGISTELGFQLHEIISHKRGLKRYLECIVKTCRILQNSNPTHVAVQNPSMVLALLAVMLKWWYRYTLVVDAHNAGIYPLEGQSRLLQLLAKFIQKNATCTIITNENLKKVVEGHGGVACILPDKIPTPPETLTLQQSGERRICFICTYAQDEPYRDVIKAAALIPDDIIIMITGNYNNKVDPAGLPGNVRLLGYLPEDHYWATLRSSDLVMDLTTRDDCLVCGAYEGLSLLKPLILSNSQASRNYFYKGCVYVDSDPNSIASGIRKAVHDFFQLQHEVADLKDELDSSWKKYADTLKVQIAAA